MHGTRRPGHPLLRAVGGHARVVRIVHADHRTLGQLVDFAVEQLWTVNAGG